MDVTELKGKLLKLAERIGAQTVSIELQRKGLRPSTSERLSRGTHIGGLKPITVRAVEAVLKESRAS